MPLTVDPAEDIVNELWNARRQAFLRSQAQRAMPPDLAASLPATDFQGSEAQYNTPTSLAELAATPEAPSLTLRDLAGPENRARGIYPQGPRTAPLTLAELAGAMPVPNITRGTAPTIPFNDLNGAMAARLYANEPVPRDETAAERTARAMALAGLTPPFEAFFPSAPSAGGPASFLSEVAAAPSRLLARGIGELPAPMGLGGMGPTALAYGKPGRKVKESDPVTQFVAQSLPYVVAPEAGAAVFVASLPATLQEQIGAYQRGDISGKQLAANLALTLGPLIAPELAKLGVKGVAKAAAVAKTPEGQQVLRGALARLAQERGGGTFGEKPPESLTAHMTPEQEQVAIAGQMENRLRALGEQPPASELPRAGAETGAQPPKALPPVPDAVPQHVVPPAAPGGQGAPPAGGGPPTTTGGPTGGEILPPVNAKFIQALQQATIKPIERAKLLKAGRSRQAGRVASALADEGTSTQRLAAAGPARAGQILPDFQPIGERFTGEELVQLHDQITGAYEQGKIGGLSAARAYDVMQRIMLGGKQPQPAERALLARIYGPDFAKAIPETPEKWNLWNETLGVLGIPQTFATAFDASAPLRQGWVTGASHPFIWAKTFVPMMKAMASERASNAIDEAIRAKPWFTGAGELKGYGYEDVGGHISDLSRVTESGVREPQFASLNNSFVTRMVEKFPGIRMSERGFVTFLNKLRTDVYASEAQRMWDGGIRDVSQYEALATTVNHATGWGAGPVGQVTQGLNVFFAPRNVVARFQVLTDPFTQPGSLLKPGARQLAAKNLVAFVAMNAGIVELLHVMGVGSVTWDPRRTDFGKLLDQRGRTRLDPWAGFSPLARLVVQMATGERVSAGGVTSAADRKQLAIRFVRGKLGPVPSLVVDLFQGKSGIGEPTDLTSAKGIRTQLYNRMVPFFAQDMNDAIQQSGLKGGLLAAPGFFGAGVLTYPPSVKGTVYDALAKAGLPDAEKAFQGDQWRQYFSAQGFPMASNYSSLGDFKTAYVESWMASIAKNQRVSVERAKDIAARQFDNLPSVKHFRDQEQRARLEFWKAHPDLLMQAVDANVEELNKDEQRIYDAYRKTHPVTAGAR